ncbi:MAG: hypothetical protein ICV85_15585, partial [Tolypothrix sp. T3-bin4]|nr:hypothetical protein [Tolypothrix sp. T3-bin4]
IAKSGKKTNGYDLFYNGSHSRVERGLEVSLVAVVDVETEIGYALLAEQTFDQSFCPELTRMDYYLRHLEITQPQLPEQIRYLAVDGAYAKERMALRKAQRLIVSSFPAWRLGTSS